MFHDIFCWICQRYIIVPWYFSYEFILGISIHMIMVLSRYIIVVFFSTCVISYGIFQYVSYCISFFKILFSIRIFFRSPHEERTRGTQKTTSTKKNKRGENERLDNKRRGGGGGEKRDGGRGTGAEVCIALGQVQFFMTVGRRHE